MGDVESVMTGHDPDVLHHADLDARMVRAVRGIKLLGMVSWPIEVQYSFLARWGRGDASLPEVEYPVHDFSETRRELAAIVDEADPDHPLGHYVAESALSWSLAAELLEAIGTPKVTEFSIRLFGHPDAPLPGNGPTTCEAARHFIDIANELDPELLAPSEQVSISATALQLQLQSDLDDFFNGRVIDVVLDPHLIAKAAAGATRIRLRSGAAFSDYDRHQLLEHEAFVHSLTALNGRAQPLLPSMALSSPRTTATQEGLATFAEQITGSIDIERMKRVSLRIEAVAHALDGANFIDVFRYFLDAGQQPPESFASAQRVFRGVPLTGGFFGKFYIFKAALESKLYWLTILGLLNSAVGAYYYLRILVVMYMHEPGEAAEASEPLTPGLRIALLLPALGTLFLGIFPTWVLDFAGKYSAIVK